MKFGPHFELYFIGAGGRWILPYDGSLFAFFRNFFDILTHLKVSCNFGDDFLRFLFDFWGFGRDFERIFGEFSVIFGDFFGKGETL